MDIRSFRSPKGGTLGFVSLSEHLMVRLKRDAEGILRDERLLDSI